MSETLRAQSEMTLSDVLADGLQHRIMSAPFISDRRPSLFWINADPGDVEVMPPVTEAPCYLVVFRPSNVMDTRDKKHKMAYGVALNSPTPDKLQIIANLETRTAFLVNLDAAVAIRRQQFNQQ